tara:strand:- start:185 stop:847 length:663 start_codon:yes stop_codon:yes gene_type:complete
MNNLHQLEKKININFKNKTLLKQAITHKSYDKNVNNEKLEFIGDRILGFVIAKKLLEIFPSDSEGILDKKLASLVNKNKCLEISKKFNLNKFIMTGNKQTKPYIIEDKIVSDACEALIGAIFYDQGIKIVEKFILDLWSNNISNSVETKVDAKTKLQEYSLKKFKILPIYKILSTKGPKHKPLFNVSVKIKNNKYVEGSGLSKKEAEQNAASKLLDKIGL